MTYTRDSAQALAMDGLIHVAGQPALAQAFLAATGLRPDDLRRAASDPGIALHILDFLVEDDQRVLSAAAALGVGPGDLMRARTVLAGPGSHGWEP